MRMPKGAHAQMNESTQSVSRRLTPCARKTATLLWPLRFACSRTLQRMWTRLKHAFVNCTLAQPAFRSSWQQVKR
jgi:hypothetical protein